MNKFKKLISTLLIFTLFIQILPINYVHAATAYNISEYTTYTWKNVLNESNTFHIDDKNGAYNHISYRGVVYNNNKYYLDFNVHKNGESQYLIVELHKINGNKIYLDTTKYISIPKESNHFLYEIPTEYMTNEYFYFKLSVADSKKVISDEKLVKYNNTLYDKLITSAHKSQQVKINETYDMKVQLLFNGTVTYTTSNPKVATVDKNGVVTAHCAGTASITAKASFGASTNCVIFVDDPKFPFYDVSPTQWYRQTIEKAYELGLMTGTAEHLFKPDANMSRAMVACVLHRINGSPMVEYVRLFSDTSKFGYYAIPLTWAKKEGIINGYNDGTFKPHSNITREEVITIIYNYSKYMKLNVSSSKDLSGYKDFKQISPYAKKPLQWAVERGIISGKDNGTRLDPKGYATRAECSKMFLTINNWFN